MKTTKLFAALLAAALFASCGGDDDNSGDFGQIKVPDTSQLEQTAGADDRQTSRGVTFTTEGAWSSSITEKTRADAPDWIAVSPDRGAAAGTYTLKIILETNPSVDPRTATVTVVCGTSKIEIDVTQQGTDNPIVPTPSTRISKIECFYEEVEHPEKNRPTETYYFEYDKQSRITKIDCDDLEDQTSGMDQTVTFSYPDAATLKFTFSEGSGTRSFTASLDNAGRAAEVRLDNSTERWAFAYDTQGRCTECRQSGINQSTFYPRSAFRWADGNLVGIDTFDEADKPVEDYSFTFTYTDQRNSAQATSLDLNALLFDVCPSYMPIYGPDMAQILATAGRLGARSANLTKSNVTEEIFSPSTDPDDPNIHYYYEIRPENEVIEWETDDNDRVTRVFSTLRVLYIKENIQSGKKEIIDEKSYTQRNIYVVSY